MSENGMIDSRTKPAVFEGLDFPGEWRCALTHSNFLRQSLSARHELGEWLVAHWKAPLTAERMEEFLREKAFQNETELKHVLRLLRQRVMALLIVRDIAGLAPLSEVTATMTALADIATNAALDFLHRQLAAQYGEPLDEQGRAQRLLVIGMGKLGGGELNVSSDVDYIFVYPEDGETAGDGGAGGAGGSGGSGDSGGSGGSGTGGRKIDNYDFFNRLGKRLIAALDEVTADGRVFRVDMRLRPNGDSGPLVCSLDALENYFITQGREWERYAWIKARAMNAGVNLNPEALTALRGIERPFVFRKYLDFGAINAMRDLHAQIRREVARRDRAGHIKLGPGGIREIEFIAQVFQLIRGGRDSALQIRPTLEVLAVLVERRLISEEGARELREAYDFLRRLEHRLQYAEDAQTHELPEDGEARASVAATMGFSDWDDFFTVLEAHRQRVSHHFEAVFSDPGEGGHELDALWGQECDAEEGMACFSRLGYARPADAWGQLERLRTSGRYRQLPASNRERLDAVGPQLIAAAAGLPEADAAFSRGLDFLETISRRGAYLAFLQQYPQALAKVAQLIGSSSWAAEYLKRYPLLLDEILDPGLLDTATGWQAFWQAFRSDLERQLAEGNGDVEREMDILREAHHAQVFRLLAQDLAGLHTVERISDHLTELADVMLAAAIRLAWKRIAGRHREAPRFAAIGYGKLGGKELGYASDLDLVFLYDDDAPEAEENYAKLARRVNTWLSSQTASGILFETDLRLRPNGEAGLLAVSVAAFREYELHHAWVWEHQALTRARFCVGDAAIGERFEAIRREILCAVRDPEELKDKILEMRRKMLDTHASEVSARTPESFDLKQDTGGIIDVEFIVQYLVLAHAHAHPELCGNLGNIALLRIAAELGLIAEEESGPAREAYREYRRLQHRNQLNAQPKAPIARAGVAAHIAAVERLWQSVFGRCA